MGFNSLRETNQRAAGTEKPADARLLTHWKPSINHFSAKLGTS